MYWDNNQLLDDDDNILAIVQWDNDSHSWEYINKLDDTGIYGYDSKADAIASAKASVRKTLIDREEDDTPINPPDTIANLGLYGMF